MTYDSFRRRDDYPPLSVLDALISAGLGDRPQHLISREQFERAMAGMPVHRRGPGPWRSSRERYLERRKAYLEAVER